jgi:hypothetical protein
VKGCDTLLRQAGKLLQPPVRAEKAMPQTIAARNISSRRLVPVRLWILRRIRLSFICEIGFVGVSESRPPRGQRNHSIETHDSASGISRAATHAECGCPKEILAMQSLRWRGIPCSCQGLFRPHYVTWSEQLRIESHGPTLPTSFGSLPRTTSESMISAQPMRHA